MNALLEHLREQRELLRSPVADCVSEASAAGEKKLFAVRFAVAPRDVLPDFMAAQSRDAFFWQEPSRGVSLLGLGRVTTLEGRGPKRFGEVSSHARELFRDLHVYDVGQATLQAEGVHRADQRGPFLLGGFGFYDGEADGEADGDAERESEWAALGAGRLVLPELSIVVREGTTIATRTCAIEPNDSVDVVLDRLCSELERDQATDIAMNALLPLAREVETSWDDAELGPEIRVQADRPHDRYLAQVEAALEAIDAGKFEKVVLARSLEVRADQDFDLASFLACLREIYPSCATLAVREGDSWFISATPERLVSLQGDRVTTAAVAGSAPRGRSHDEEAQHSALLLESEKERVEHEVVKRSIREALAESCGPLEGPDAPRLLKLEGIQHLETPLKGRLLPKWRGELGVLDLVSALHPTPAVGGAPSASALDWLEQHEALDRGWYAGPVGYLDGSGDGEFRVALRSALLRGSHARLFAGAGIVAGSEPERELAETRLKLRALLAPLTEI